MEMVLSATPASRNAAAWMHVVIETSGDRFRDRHQILVAAVTGTCEHDDAPSRDVQALCEVGHRGDGVSVMAVVEQHLERMLVEHVHAAGRLEEG